MDNTNYLCPITGTKDFRLQNANGLENKDLSVSWDSPRLYDSAFHAQMTLVLVAVTRVFLTGSAVHRCSSLAGPVHPRYPFRSVLV